MMILLLFAVSFTGLTVAMALAIFQFPQLASLTLALL
jgi:hypothetical protein